MEGTLEAEILIAGRTEEIQNYKRALQLVGMSGVGMYERDKAKLRQKKGLLLPGGGDIAPELFGQCNKGSREINKELDELQLSLLDAYCEQRKPVFGICKGIQIINVYFGGTICQHLPTAHTHEYRGEDRYHMTIAKRDSVLAHLYGLRFPVNSAHHQGIERLGEHLEAIQFAEDCVIEGIVHTALPIWGVQWHPERMLGMGEGDCRYGERILEEWGYRWIKSSGS